MQESLWDDFEVIWLVNDYDDAGRSRLVECRKINQLHGKKNGLSMTDRMK